MGAKNAFFEPFFYMQTIVLPRQARDKDERKRLKERRFFAGTLVKRHLAQTFGVAPAEVRARLLRLTAALNKRIHSHLCLTSVCACSCVCGFVWSVDIPRDGDALL